MTTINYIKAALKIGLVISLILLFPPLILLFFIPDCDSREYKCKCVNEIKLDQNIDDDIEALMILSLI